MALNSGLKTVKDILADIKTLTSKDEFHTGTHVLLAKTKAGKFAGSITWITSTDKKLINTKRVGTDVYNAHSLNFFMILREEEINIAYQSLTRFISDVQSPEFDKAVRMGSLPDWTGFIPILIRTTNTVHQDLVKYLREFFAGLPEREDLVWEYAYEPPLDKPLIALPIHAYKYWGNKFLNSMVEHIARESPKDRLVFTLMATNPLTKTNLLLSFIITNQPNPDNGTIAYADKASGVTIYLSCGTSDPRWFMVIFKSFVWALCNDRALTYPTLKDRVKALADPSGANSEKLMHYLEEFFKMFGFQLPKVSDIETLHWDFLYGTYSETWSWFVDEQFNPLSKNTLPKEKEHDVSDQNLIEKISESVENKALPGAMWFVMLMDGREVQRPLTFLLTTRENNSNGIYHSISWTKSLDFVIDISKINALKFMENFSNFISILMVAKPGFFNDSSFTKIIKSFSNEWGFADDFIIALNVFFDERAMEPDYNPNEPIRWSYTCGNNAPGDFGIYNDLLFSRITNLRTKEELLTKSTEVVASEVIDKIDRLAPKPALWFALSGHNRGESNSHSLTFLLTDHDEVVSAIGERNVDFVLDISNLDRVDYLTKFGEFLHELMTNGMSGENFLWAVTRVVFPVGLTKDKTEKRLSEVFSKLGSPDQIQWGWSRNTNCTKTFGWYMDLDLDLLASPKAQRKGKAKTDPFYELKRSPGDKAPVGLPDTQYGSCLLTTFKEAKVYFVDSLKSLQQLENDLGRKDLVQAPKRDMENWFVYPEPRGKTIRLNNFDFVVVLGRGDDKSPYVPVIAHEAMHVVLSLCKQIGYDPLNEQEPAAYAMEYLVKQALGFFALNEGASSK